MRKGRSGEKKKRETTKAGRPIPPSLLLPSSSGASLPVFLIPAMILPQVLCTCCSWDQNAFPPGFCAPRTLTSSPLGPRTLRPACLGCSTNKSNLPPPQHSAFFRLQCFSPMNLGPPDGWWIYAFVCSVTVSFRKKVSFAGWELFKNSFLYSGS